MASKSPVLRKAVGKVASVAANFVPGGSLVKGAIGLGASLLGSKGGASNRKRRSFSMSRAYKRYMQAKINSKITKVRLSAWKGL